LPVTAGAAALKAFRATREPLPAGQLKAMGAGAAAALAAGLAARGAYRRVAASGSYAPLAAYRMTLGVAVLARSRGGGSPGSPVQ
jgi:undecaprenyl pyrophosphate phosphatase UppP